MWFGFVCRGYTDEVVRVFGGPGRTARLGAMLRDRVRSAGRDSEDRIVSRVLSLVCDRYEGYKMPRLLTGIALSAIT